MRATPHHLVAALAAALASLCAQAAEGAQPQPDTRLSIPVPQGLAPERCLPLEPKHALQTLELERTFVDQFEQLDLQRGPWQPHFNAGFDSQKKTWIRHDDSIDRRTLPSNSEQQLYVDPAYRGGSGAALGLNPFRIEPAGVLKIGAQRQDKALRDKLFGYEFTSGVLTTRASFLQQHGYFEVRAKLPAGHAMWPAFWLLPHDGSWPPEIDVLEARGQRPDEVESAAHWLGDDGKQGSSGCKHAVPGAQQDFHLYAVLWQPQRITYYIDRKPVAHLATPRGFDKPMYMLLNLAVGGAFTGAADARTPSSASFQIDWVAAYGVRPNCAPDAGLHVEQLCKVQ
jgi:beta-glucanase (GH16 family)